MATTYLPHVKLANIAIGQAEVRWFTPHSPDVPFGSSVSLGWVIRPRTRWVAQDTHGVALASFASREEAVKHLVANRSVDQV